MPLNSYAITHPRAGIAVNLLLLAALGLLLVGLYAPILTLEKFYFFANTVSLLSALQTLHAEGELGMVMLLGTFSLVFPVVKLLWLLWIWNIEDQRSQRHRRHLHWLNLYSKWSMLDVFVVALLVVTVKLGALAQAHIEYGIYAFAASVILVMLAGAWIGRYSQQ